jgi:4'-phosphopantetheinyl transferase EntD
VRSLGIDAERLLDERAKDELLARICGKDELSLLGESLDAPLRHLVSFAFSAKESLYKCLYPLVGKFMDFSAARVVEARGELTDVGGRGALTLELSVDWSSELTRGRRFEAPFFASSSHVESAIVLLA